MLAVFLCLGHYLIFGRTDCIGVASLATEPEASCINLIFGRTDGIGFRSLVTEPGASCISLTSGFIVLSEVKAWLLMVLHHVGLLSLAGVTNLLA